MQGVDPTNVDLRVTTDDQTAKLFDVLGSRFTNHGQLLIPTFAQYEALVDDSGLQALAKEIYRWLGYKPHSVDVSYTVDQRTTQPIIVNTNSILVDAQYREHPLVTGGLLAMSVLRQIMVKHHAISDDRFIENASVRAGLGLWIINAFKPRTTHFESMYHMLDGNWLQHEGLQLHALTKGQYLQEFGLFTSQHRLFPEDYLRGVSKRSHHLVPAATGTDKVLPLPEPTTTKKHLKAARSMWAKLCIIALTLGVTITIGLVLWTSREKQANPDQARDQKSLSVIKTSLDDCLQQAEKQQSSYDPNDLFMTRQVDATKSRCQSLRNQYNDSLSTYQKTYLQP